MSQKCPFHQGYCWGPECALWRGGCGLLPVLTFDPPAQVHIAPPEPTPKPATPKRPPGRPKGSKTRKATK
jgi:hypothetical protein